LAFLGSWIDRKGVDTLVAAVGPVLARHPALELDLLGTNRTEAELRAVFPADTQSRVHVPGRLERAALARRLSSASIFVLPTRYEGYGMATAEAMACGCAVVTTPTGFGADLRHGENGLVVPIGDAPALANALERLVVDADLRFRLAEAGWRTVQEFRWKRSVRLLESAYADWLAMQ
jgi:glycosyltransferase involved in cell wall biosynthesis